MSKPRNDVPSYRPLSGEFEQSDLDALGRACYEMSFTLRALDQPHRTPAERQALVDRAADILFRASKAITPGVAHTRTPEHAVRSGSDVGEVYFTYYRQLVRTSRWHTWVRAASLVLGKDWFRSAPGMGAVDSEEGLRAALQALQEQRIKPQDTLARKSTVAPL